MPKHRLNDRKAEVFHPRVYILDELHARHWDAAKLEREARVPIGSLTGVLNGDRITASVAEALARAFGTSADVWVNLQRHWDED